MGTKYGEKYYRIYEKKENITEELKEKDQMKWVGLMNNIKHSAVKIVKKELLK